MIDGQIPCVDLVEMVTDWMEGGLDDNTRALLEEHLVLCAPCGAYVRQIHQALQAMRVIGADAVPPAVRQELLQAFRAQYRH
ncbi:MAG: hypothetical protein QOD72_3024 [Acidimicrobiaceae bacterium]|jgi:hypothetical protein|nr:hypothetical protein [Acidimicrobiaceae bacterium]